MNWRGNNLMRGLMGELLPDESRFRLGLHLSADDLFAGGEESVLNEIEGCLYGTGAFHEISVSATGIFDRYYLITGKTATAFAQARDLSALIVGTIQNCAVSVQTVNSVDPLMIDRPTDYPVGDGATQPSGKCAPGYFDANPWWWPTSDCRKLPAEADKPPPPPPPDRCDWNTLEWDAYLACVLGIKPSEAALVGAGVALLGVVLITVMVKR